MIKSVEIKNFKSIVDLKLELGRVNILIGANGSGKTNILEAITLASAANQDKLDNEYLGSRMRMTEPDFMLSEFDEIEIGGGMEDTISIQLIDETPLPLYALLSYSEQESEWINWGAIVKDVKSQEFIKRLVSSVTNAKYLKKIAEDFEELQGMEALIAENGDDFKDKTPKAFGALKNSLYSRPNISSFLIYAPEESKLRKFEDETAIRPLGRRGEGLFKHIKTLLSNDQEKTKFVEALNSGLSMLDWFKEIEIPTDLFTNEARLDITDRFLKETKQVFDQKSTNEGFLFLLFYLTLFNSPHTPSFFAIDNIETSFNPKLTKKLIEYLVDVAKKNDKQVIITTHSPFALDGLNLSDDEQRLFVVRRNVDGHTRVKRVPYVENRKLPLSEIWMSGVLGGLPDNF